MLLFRALFLAKFGFEFVQYNLVRRTRKHFNFGEAFKVLLLMQIRFKPTAICFWRIVFYNVKVWFVFCFKLVYEFILVIDVWSEEVFVFESVHSFIVRIENFFTFILEVLNSILRRYINIFSRKRSHIQWRRRNSIRTYNTWQNYGFFLVNFMLFWLWIHLVLIFLLRIFFYAYKIVYFFLGAVKLMVVRRFLLVLIHLMARSVRFIFVCVSLPPSWSRYRRLPKMQFFNSNGIKGVLGKFICVQSLCQNLLSFLLVA